MTEVLYRWPHAAEYGRRVPKEKFYGHPGVTASLRHKFVVQVERIVWAYKLAESTINLPGTSAVPEIQVFTVVARGDDVGEDILAAIDKSIPFPIIFEVARQVEGQREVRMVAANKQLGTGAPQLSAYFSSGWQSVDRVRLPLPTAISLPALYSLVLQSLMPLTPRPGERLSEATDRLAEVRRLEREVASLERKMHAERQFNRKVELRHALRTKQLELEQQR